MKNLLLLIITIIAFTLTSCNEDNNVEQLETVTSKIDLSSEDIVEESLTARGRNFWQDKCFQRFISKDQLAIEGARETNNQAIRAHNAEGVTAAYLDDFFILTSTNGLFTGKEEVQGIYQFVFDNREDVLFVRTPTAITVNKDWKMASENGNWIGTWIVDGEQIEVGGDYYAKWHQIDGIWKLRSEVYTQFDCSGDVVCNNRPSLQ